MRRRFCGALDTRPGGGMADTRVLEALIERCAGSTPVPGTSARMVLRFPARRVVFSLFLHGALRI